MIMLSFPLIDDGHSYKILYEKNKVETNMRLMCLKNSFKWKPAVRASWEMEIQKLWRIPWRNNVAKPGSIS